MPQTHIVPGFRLGPDLPIASPQVELFSPRAPRSRIPTGLDPEIELARRVAAEERREHKALELEKLRLEVTIL